MSPVFSTVLQDPVTAFFVGALAVALAAPMIQRSGRAGWYGLLGPFFAAWMTGVYGYLFFNYPDWMFCYLIEAKLAHLRPLYGVFAVVMVGSAVAGATLSLRHVLERRTGRAFGVFFLGLIVWVLVVLLTQDQYAHVGTTLEYRMGLSHSIDADSRFRVAFSLAGLAIAVPAIGLLALLIFEGWRTRRARAAHPQSSAATLPALGGGPPITGRSPGDGSALPPIETTPPERLPAIVAAARQAGSEWAAWSTEARAAVLVKARQRFLAAADETAALVAQETGKPLAEAYTAEVVPNADLFSYWAKEAPRLMRSIEVGLNPVLYPGKTSAIERVPRGVVALISPWNYPVSIPLRTLLPALAAGNAVVFKPSELTPRSGALLASWLQAELPPGVLQVVQGGGEVGAALVAAGPDLVAFTGSTATGRKIAEQAARGPIPVSLELGGKDAAIVLEDADLERTADGVAWGAFTNAGQNCASIERVYVVKAIADQFLERLTARAKRLRTDGPDAELGPLISERQLAVVDGQIREAREAGVRELSGGAPNGLRVPATILVLERSQAAGDRLKLLRDETFGPVVAVEIVADAEEAIARANDSAFGLAASVWTRDLDAGERIARRLRVGAVTVNNVAFTPALPMAPWSGVGASGYGVTNSPLALDGLTRPRYILLDGNRRPELWWYPYDAALVEVTRGLAALQTSGRRSLSLVLRTGKAFLGRTSAQGKRSAP